MGFTPHRRAKLVRLLGEEMVQELERQTKGESDRLHALGVEFKSRKKPVEKKSNVSWVRDVMGLQN